MTDSRPFICGKVVIDSLRDNGYKNAAYAIAEIVDNSIQAGADIVRVICYEAVSKSSNQRALRLIDKIGILDNGSGMNADILYKALELADLRTVKIRWEWGNLVWDYQIPQFSNARRLKYGHGLI